MERLYRITDFFAPHSRMVTALLCMALAMMLVFNTSPLAAVPLLLSVALIWDFFRNSGVWIAFRAFRQGNLPRVRRSIATVRWPQMLSARSSAYYHWLKGTLEAADGRYEAARVHLLVATVGALRTENDRSLVQCLLAEVTLQQGDRAAARDHLQLANALAHHADVAPIIQALRRRVEGGSA